MKQLKVIHAFRNLDDAILQKIWQAGKVVFYEKRANCFDCKDKNDSLYFIGRQVTQYGTKKSGNA